MSSFFVFVGVSTCVVAAFWFVQAVIDSGKK